MRHSALHARNLRDASSLTLRADKLRIRKTTRRSEHFVAARFDPGQRRRRTWSPKLPRRGIPSAVEDTWDRVAAAIAEAEVPALGEFWRGRFREALTDFRFLPAGRIISGAGTGRKVTLFNCFVMGTVPDDLPGIFRAVEEAAITMQKGGGVGMDFSTIRPNGSPVKGVGAEASGPLSFMDVWDAMCRTVMSAGQRRGAIMAASGSIIRT